MGEDEPWKDKQLMERLYLEEKMSAREIEEHLEEHYGNSPHRRTISSWLHRHDIPVRSYGEARTLAVLKTTTPNYQINDLGYAKIQTKHRNEKFVVAVHRLLAVAEWGFDVVADSHVHHKNGVRWDNRPDNLEVLTPEEHMRHHAEERDDWGNEAGLIAQYGAEAVLGPDEAYGSKEAAEEAKNTLVSEVGNGPGGEAGE